MNETGDPAAALRRLVGERVRYDGRDWQVADVLADGPAVILEAAGPAPAVQADQYGEARRRAPLRISVPVYADDGRTLHPEFLAIERLGA